MSLVCLCPRNYITFFFRHLMLSRAPPNSDIEFFHFRVQIHAWFSKHLMYRWPLLNRHQVNDWLVSNVMRGKYQKNDQLVYDLFDPDRDVIAIWTLNRIRGWQQWNSVYIYGTIYTIWLGFILKFLRAFCSKHVINICLHKQMQVAVR